MSDEPPADNGPLSSPVKLPLARIKRIVKQDPDISMISTAAVQTLSAAVQLFVCHFTEQALMESRMNGRNRLTYSDFADAVAHQDELDFLSSIVPRTMTYGQIKQKRDQVGFDAPDGERFDPQPEQIEEGTGEDAIQDETGSQPE